jgi:hypothetical protein
VIAPVLFFAAMKPIRLLGLAFVLTLVVWPLSLCAKVTRVEITSRADVLNGQSFGDVGPYERITGRVYISLIVSDVHNRRIVDLANAVNRKDERVRKPMIFLLLIRQSNSPRTSLRSSRKTRQKATVR